MVIQTEFFENVRQGKCSDEQHKKMKDLTTEDTGVEKLPANIRDVRNNLKIYVKIKIVGGMVIQEDRFVFF